MVVFQSLSAENVLFKNFDWLDILYFSAIVVMRNMETGAVNRASKEENGIRFLWNEMTLF